MLQYWRGPKVLNVLLERDSPTYRDAGSLDGLHVEQKHAKMDLYPKHAPALDVSYGCCPFGDSLCWAWNTTYLSCRPRYAAASASSPELYFADKTETIREEVNVNLAWS